MRIEAYMLSCDERTATRSRTLANLRQTDWVGEVVVELDTQLAERKQERQEKTARALLHRARATEADFVLFLEDDLDFNRHIRHNLQRWYPLASSRTGEHFFGSIYNPTIRRLSSDEARAFFIADPEAVYGSQAFVLAPATAGYLFENWDQVEGMQDIKMSRLAARLCPVYYHVPSLVQHLGVVSAWGGHFHWTNDFDLEWQA